MARKTTVIIKTTRVQDPQAHEKLVAELWCGDILLGELSSQAGDIHLEIYPSPTGKWRLELEEFLEFLSQGKQDLLNRMRERG